MEKKDAKVEAERRRLMQMPEILSPSSGAFSVWVDV
jgi:hypothetical protein